MPVAKVNEMFKKISIKKDKGKNLDSIRDIAKKFKVSNYATVVRLRNLKHINQKTYLELVKLIEDKHQASKKEQKEIKTPIARNISNEKIRQYGEIYTNTIIQAYYNSHLTLYKARNMFEFKKTQDFTKMIGKTV